MQGALCPPRSMAFAWRKRLSLRTNKKRNGRLAKAVRSLTPNRSHLPPALKAFRGHARLPLAMLAMRLAGGVSILK